MKKGDRWGWGCGYGYALIFFWIYTTHIYTYDIENEIKLYSIYYDGTFIHAHTLYIYIHAYLIMEGKFW